MYDASTWMKTIKERIWKFYRWLELVQKLGLDVEIDEGWGSIDTAINRVYIIQIQRAGIQ